MARTAEIKCINKDTRSNIYARVIFVGTSSWKLTQQDAIGKIQRGEWSFYLVQNGREVPIIVGESRFGHKYLKAESDGDEPTSLLGLPECL